MTHPYELQNVTKTPKGRITADLTEHGVIIGKVTRPAIQNHFVAPFAVKFLGERAKARFDDFADSLSIGETVEALLPN